MASPETTHLIQITTSLGWGGRETLPLAIHQWRIARGMPSQLVVGAGSSLAEHACSIDCVCAIPRARMGMVTAFRRILRDLSDAGEISIVCHFTRDLPAIRAALIGFPRVPLFVVKHVSPGSRKRDIGHWIVYKRVNRLLAVSEYVREKCARVYPIDSSRTAVWHPGVDVGRFSFNPELRERIRTEAGITPDELVMGYVARITPNKGLEDLIDATADLYAFHPRLRLWIAGTSSSDERAYEQQLRDRVDSLGLAGNVRFAGWQDNPAGFLSAIDLFVVPSQHEAFGLSTVEAMACARPVVGFRAGGTAEIVVDDETGLLADPEAAPATNLAASIRSLIDDPDHLADLGRQGRARAEILFSHQAMMERFHTSIAP